jgi:hypothetical protein
MARKSTQNPTRKKNCELVRQIGRLMLERRKLEEEVLQLIAAVNIWSSVCRQTIAAARNSGAVDLETQ